MEALLESSLSYQSILSAKCHLLCPYSQGLVYGRISLLLICTPVQPPTPELQALCSSTKGTFLSGIQFTESFLHTPLIICPIEKYDFYFVFLLIAQNRTFIPSYMISTEEVSIPSIFLIKVHQLSGSIRIKDRDKTLESQEINT